MTFPSHTLDFSYHLPVMQLD